MKRVLLFLLLFSSFDAFAAQDITLRGRDFYLDGKPWLPKGIDVEAFQRPAFIPSAPKWMNDPDQLQPRRWWGAAELKAMHEVFGATLLRLTISQPGLDPRSSIYDAKYADEILEAVKQSREAGFAVILSMDAQGENGLANLPCMPDDSTGRAWKTLMLTPALANDPGVMFELFNEPCRANWDVARKEWAGEMQGLIDMLRATGARNILLADGLGFAQWANDLFPLLHDSVPDHLALAFHPYFDGLAKEPSTTPDDYFLRRFARDAARYPMIATEWNAGEGNGCSGEHTPEIALELMRTLQRLHVGLVGWAIDSGHGKLVKDHDRFEPTDFANWRGCAPKGQPVSAISSGGGKLLADFPND